jgi:hypothetical protein
MEAMKKPKPPSPRSIVPQARMYRTPWVLDQHGNLAGNLAGRAGWTAAA